MQLTSCPRQNVHPPIQMPAYTLEAAVSCINNVHTIPFFPVPTGRQPSSASAIEHSSLDRSATNCPISARQVGRAGQNAIFREQYPGVPQGGGPRNRSARCRNESSGGSPITLVSRKSPCQRVVKRSMRPSDVALVGTARCRRKTRQAERAGDVGAPGLGRNRKSSDQLEPDPGIVGIPRPLQ